MIKISSTNERIKRKYFDWQLEAQQKSVKTVDQIRYAIDRYEAFINYEDFKGFNSEKAKAFKKHLSASKNQSTGKNLSKRTIYSTIRAVKDFFVWLSSQPGYKSKIHLSEVEYLNLSEKDIRIAQAPKRKRSPTIPQVINVLRTMPSETDVQKRDRALVAFALATGMRDNAIVSLRLKHVNLEEGLVEQRPDEDVRTKFSKTIFTYFFPVGGEVLRIIEDWVLFLYKQKLFNDDDPLFPRTKVVQDKNFDFVANGLEPKFWQGANQVRKIFQKAFKDADLPYFSPHTFRNTIVRLGERVCKTPEDFKAWSQNLGHEHVATTFSSYGYVEEYRQGEIIRGFALRENMPEKDEIEKAMEVFKKLQNKVI